MKKCKAVVSLILPYISIILLSMVSISYLGWILAESYQERIVEEKQKSIELAAERLLDKMDEVERIALNVESSTVVERYAFDSVKNTDVPYSECLTVKNELQKQISDSIVEEIYLYDGKNDRMIAASSMTSKAMEYFRYCYVIDGLTPEESLNRINNLTSGDYNTATAVKFLNNPRNVVEYCLKVPLEWNGTHTLKIVLVMNVENLFADLIDICDIGSEFYVYDNTEKLIYAYGSQYEALLAMGDSAKLRPLENDNQIYGAVYQSSDRSVNVKFFVPELRTNRGMNIPHFWLLVIIPVMAGVMLCFYFTYKNHKEIGNILKTLNKHSENGEENYPDPVGFDAIRESAERLADENGRYREEIADFNKVRKKMIFDQLIRGIYSSEEEMTKALRQIAFNSWERKCEVMCIRYKGADYRRMIGEDLCIKDLVKEMLMNLPETGTEIWDSTARDTVCIFMMDNEENGEVFMRDVISRLKVEVFYPYGIGVEIGAGNIVKSIFEAGVSYKQAKEVIKYRETADNNVYLYSDLKQLKDTYYYPMENDELIYNYIVAGKAENAKEIIRKLYRENMEESQELLSVSAIEMLKQRLEKCLLSVAEKYHVSPEEYLEQWQREQNVKRYFDGICDFVDWITNEIGSRKESMQSQLVTKIVQHIKVHYAENDLYLKKIAYEFGFDENYISVLFKSIYGENLPAVIEKIRIEKACALLEQSGMKVYDISVNVGYNSDISFRRAFKKVMGITPLEYREIYSKKDHL